MQPFVDNLGHPPGCKFDLSSLPVIFHLEKQQQKVDDIRAEIEDDVSNFNFKRVSIIVLHMTLHESKIYHAN